MYYQLIHLGMEELQEESEDMPIPRDLYKHKFEVPKKQLAERQATFYRRRACGGFRTAFWCFGPRRQARSGPW